MIFLSVASMFVSLLRISMVYRMCFSQLAQELINLSRLRLIIKLQQSQEKYSGSSIPMEGYLMLGQQFELYLIMWTLYRQPLQKEYHAKFFSRSSMLSVACCLFAFIVPILILTSIGYSWNQYQLSLIQPTFSFQNYQATCLLSTDTATYDSSFSNELSTSSYQVFASAGGEGNDLIISATIVPADVQACTLQLYLKVALDGRIPTIAVLPIHFYRNNENNALYLSSVKQWGTIKTSLTYALPQSSVTSGEGLLYFLNGTQTLTMTETHKNYGIYKNISLVPSIGGSQVSYSSTSGSMSYEGRFTVVSSNFLEEVSLLSNIRSFVPFFIYLFILGWVFLAQPTVRWMLQNKIYKAKVSHHKVKLH